MRREKCSLTVVRNFRILSVTCKTYFVFLLNLFRACFIHGPLKCSVTGRACFNWHGRGPPASVKVLTRSLPFFFCMTASIFFFFFFWQDVQLHGRWVVLRWSREHSPHRLHGNRLLDAVPPLQQLHAPGPVAVLRSREMHDTHRQYW